MRTLVALVVAAALAGGGATLATATRGGGWHHGAGSAHVQYKKKQLCKSTATRVSHRARHLTRCFKTSR